MLPAGKFPRLATGAALLLPALLVLDLKFFHSSPLSLLLANSLCVVMVALAAASCFRVARHTSGYAHQLWTLLSVAFAVETLAQATSAYYQSFVAGSFLNPLPSDILFFVWAAPVFMIFLPRSADDSPGSDSLRMLDFLQVAIVAVTIYLYFFYTPSRWHTQHALLLREILYLYIGRDLVLTIAFFTRSRATRSDWLRSACFVFGWVFFTAVLSDASYLWTLRRSLSAASWADLVWMSSYVIVVLFAVTWKHPVASEVSFLPGPVATFLATQFLPIGMPLLVIFMSRAIAHEQVMLAWLAVTASVVCSSVRLILTNRVQRQISEDLLSTEKALRASEQLSSNAFRSSPDSFSINVFPDGPYIDINDGFTRLTGYTREETLGRSPQEMKLWADPLQRTKLLGPLAEGQEVRNLEISYHTKSGQSRVGLMSACLIQRQEQQCVLVVVRDITARKQAEDLVRSSEERFRSLVQKLHVGIATYDPQGNILFGNQALSDLFGISPNQGLGKNTTTLGITGVFEDGSIVPRELLPVPRVIATHQPVRNLVIGWQLLGRTDTIWTLVDAIPEFLSTGELLRVVVSVTNLTEERRAVAALRESEERFRTLVQNLHAAVILHRPDGAVAFANPAACRLLELPGESEYLGKLPAELGISTLSEDGRVLSFDERPVTIALRSRSPIRDVVVGLHLGHQNKTVWVYGSSIPHIDERGNLVGTITSFVDVTEQRRANDALRESEERFRTLVRDLHVAVVLYRPDGRIEYGNPAAYHMFGVPEGTAENKFPEDYGVVPVDENGKDIPMDRRPVKTVIRNGVPLETSVLGLRYPGAPNRIVWIYGNVVPQFDPNGKLIRVIASFADITEMRNAQRAVRQLSTELLKLQDEERRRIGRELHDGLAQTVLAINLSLAQARQSINPRQHASGQALDRARAMTHQMSREIRTLSYLLHPPLLDDLGLLSALKEYVQGFSERSGIHTTLEIVSAFARLPQSIELALFRVIQESLGNVQKHSGSASAVVRLSYENATVRLEVVDSGHGLILPSNGAHDPRAARLGVGIPGMRERIAQLGGHLHIISGPNGTTVRATIPVPESAAVENAASAECPGSAGAP